jgi:broad specificity phosphatase PhoE
MKNELILLCHAATHAMKAGFFPTLDDPIEHLERPRLSALASAYRPERVVTSTALAAVETGQAFGMATSSDALWSDLDHGRWQGRSLKEVYDEEADALGAWLSEPDSAVHGGESLEALQARVRSALDTQRSGSVTLIITHAIVVKVALATVLEAPLAAVYRMDLEPLSAITLTRSDNTWRLRYKSSV